MRGQRTARQPQVRKVNGFIVFVDDVLGEGQYGKVCKAQLASDIMKKQEGPQMKQQAVRSTVDSTKKIYACKIIVTLEKQYTNVCVTLKYVDTMFY